ncbi:hypothetical protein BH11BAC2_BH11BAC2_01610 [soil metagenome]
MKKSLTILAGLLVIGFGSADAQIKNDRGTFNKPTTGEWSFETQMTLNVVGGGLFNLNDGFLQKLSGGLDRGNVYPSSVDPITGETSGAGSLGATLPLIRARKFVSETEARRFLVNLSIASENQKSGSIKSSKSEFGIALGYGIEKHQAGAERLSTYLGADALLGFARIGAKEDDAKNSQSGFGVGLRAFTGMDYYIVPKVYLGIELGWGIGFNAYGEVKIDGNGSDSKSSDFTLTPYILPSFRLGYRL